MIPIQLSVVIPVRDERENLRPLWEELRGVLLASDRSFEVILVDDGSRDGSREVIRELSREDTRVGAIFLQRAAGQSAALDAGFKAARGDWVIMLDADLQTDPADIPRMLDSLGTLDALVGYRRNRQDSFARRIVSRMANAIRNVFLGEAIRDTGCSLKLFRRSCLSKLCLFDGMHRFLPALLRLEGYRVGELAVGHRPRRWGRSKYPPSSRLIRPVVDLLAVWWMQRRKLRYRLQSGEDELRERERSTRAG